ncbi:MAG: hypothetical protein K9K81_11005 [Desulfobacteraceae bacterium]|nr:hypothetical protein [Desulfobacteraceae bacterium]
METSWVFGESNESFVIEANRQWQRHVKPHFGEILEDENICETLCFLGSEEVLKRGELDPAFPMETILRAHKGKFTSPEKLLKEALSFYAWRQAGRFYLDYELIHAVSREEVDFSDRSACAKCGICCTKTAGGSCISQTDKYRIISFFKKRRLWREDIVDEVGEFRCVQVLETLLNAIDYIGQQVRTQDGDLFLFTCPFLDRFNDEKSLCLIELAKPAVCRKYGRKTCAARSRRNQKKNNTG